MLFIGQIVMVITFFGMAKNLDVITVQLAKLTEVVTNEANRQFRKDHPLQADDEPKIQQDLWIKCPHCLKAISKAGLRIGSNKCPHCRGEFVGQ